MPEYIEENIELLDMHIFKGDAIVVNLKKGNKNDKIVAGLLEDKINNTWVKQKEKLEGKKPK